MTKNILFQKLRHGYLNGIKPYLKKRLTEEQWNNLAKIRVKLSDFFKSIYLSIKYGNYITQNYLSVVAIIKNEGPYIAEWIEYHLLVGVNKFYIYDNESEDNLKEILAPYIEDGIVEYEYCPGTQKQMWVYHDILEKARKETYWLAVIDCDEFIVPISTETISELLKRFEGYGGLGINWLVYGSSGRQTKTEGLVIERFKDHSEKNFHSNGHIKTIVNPRYVLQINIHDAVYRAGKFCVNTNKEVIKGPFSGVVFDQIRINHYFGKSYEEFLQKRQRGMADHKDEKRSMQNFYGGDRNEEKNDSIMNKYIPVIYKKLEERYSRLVR
ncbi:MAG: glycosyltransferase family 92 protein [Spirochaetaceae bacterium]|jgi:hypothetical protein|nr:glycosyltransferase family 92 protein [Spirochaetaceae bacterium]